MACVTTPTLIDLPPASERATGFGMNCSLAMAASTARTLESRTRAVPFRMRETVLGDTPASFATISRVTAEPFVAAAARRSSSDRRMLRFLAIRGASSAGFCRGDFAAPQHNARPNEYRMGQRLTRVPGVR